MIYTLTLNPAIDYVVQLGTPLTPGAINRSREEAYQFGGKGINVSNVLRALGMDTTALGFIAGFTGKALEEGLRDMGLATRLILLESGYTRVNVKVKGGEETEINGAGPVIRREDMETLYAQLDTLEKEDVLVLSGSVPGSLPADTYGQLLARVAEKQVLCVVDAAGEQLKNALPYRPFLIKPNLPELQALLGRELDSDTSIIAAAARLQEMGARNVLVSLGGDGALLLEECGQVHRSRCPAGRVANSVGAGDSMVAGFLTGWLRAKDMDYALRLGIAAGSATAFSLGLATAEEIQRLMVN